MLCEVHIMFTKILRMALVLSILLAGNVMAAQAAPLSSSPGTQFLHVATTINTSGNATMLDHPLLNNQPNAIFFVTHNWNPGGVGGTYHEHNFGVYYVANRWRIFNQDLSTMQPGATFNIFIPTPGANVFVQKATADNISGNTTLIDHPQANNDPNAILLVTQNWNPEGGLGIYNNHPIGVYYTGSNWAIFNQDLTAIPENASFNVFILPEGTGFVHRATAGNTILNRTHLDHPLTNQAPNALVFITPNWNPGGGGGTYASFPVGVYYSTSQNQIAVYNENFLGTMPTSAAFNVLVLPPTPRAFVHTANESNSTENVTRLSSALLNGYPNAVLFATQNWNPYGRALGVYNNNQIGAWYNNTNQSWNIFNQNTLDDIPNSAAFNILVPHPDATVFVHRAITDNTFGHITQIDHPLTNNNPEAILLVTHNYNPGGTGGTYNNHPLGVYYDAPYWHIFNQDLAAMPENALFNVIVPQPRAGEDVFVHKATPGNTIGNNTTIDHPLANNNPNAILIATPNYNPGDTCPCVYLDMAYGVYYQTSTQKWAIFNQNLLGGMPTNAAFNVYVLTSQMVYLPMINR